MMGGDRHLQRRLAAVCGRNCAQCDDFQAGHCRGCGYQLGQTPQGECAVFVCCVVERGLEHCGLCVDFPCQLFLSLAPPLEVNRRYRALCRRAAIGTDAWLQTESGG
ncbi:MAG TPA: DUF3795 domain-containing protein [Anaerolineae bacterium]|nr:DUF3795 domain-containing protein [Anaerolineae bacterium]